MKQDKKIRMTLKQHIPNLKIKKPGKHNSLLKMIEEQK